MYTYDVVVTGSGSGGLSAAISSARAGVKTLLVDKNGFVGGLAASGLPYLGYFDSRRRLAVGGFATEFVERLTKDGGAAGYRYCPKHYSVVGVMPDVVKVTAADICNENGVDVILHSTAVDVKKENGRITSVIYECAGTHFEVSAKVFVDATGDGVISYLAGAEYEKGTCGVDLQPSSTIMTVGGVNKKAFFEWLEANPEELGEYTLEYLKESPNFTFVTLGGLYKKLAPENKWPMGIWAMIAINRFNDSEITINGPRIAFTDPTDPISMTKAELQGRKEAFAFVQTLREYVGGFENAFLSNINDTIGSRESRRICGVKRLETDTVVNGIIADDTIALGSYPIDIHSSKDNTSDYIKLDKPYGIPYLATVSSSVSNLMTAGRCISTDQKSFGSSRVMGTCFAVGEGVGIGAALSVMENIKPACVDVKEVRKILKDRKAVLYI